MRKRTLALSALLVTAAATLAQAQHFTTAPCPDHNNDSGGWFGHDAHACEIRQATVPLVDGRLGVTETNGPIEVIGEDRSDIALEARVTTQASSQSDADALLHQVEIVTASRDIHAVGPTARGGFLAQSHRSWSVSYKLRVPRHITRTELRTSNGNIRLMDVVGQVSAHSSNGPIEVTHVRGDVEVETTNGGLHLDDVNGAVHAATTNGGVQIALSNDQWQGSGLFAESTNGGVTIKAPERFRAHLVADTTNGGISIAFPVTLQGKLGHHVDTDVNGGGAPVHLTTTNGGISIQRL